MKEVYAILTNPRFPNKKFEIHKDKLFNTYSLYDCAAVSKKPVDLPANNIPSLIAMYESQNWTVDFLSKRN